MVGCRWGPWGLKFGEELSLNGFLKANPLASHGKGLQVQPLGSEISATNIHFELLIPLQQAFYGPIFGLILLYNTFCLEYISMIILL